MNTFVVLDHNCSSVRFLFPDISFHPNISSHQSDVFKNASGGIYGCSHMLAALNWISIGSDITCVTQSSMEP